MNVMILTVLPGADWQREILHPGEGGMHDAVLQRGRKQPVRDPLIEYEVTVAAVVGLSRTLLCQSRTAIVESQLLLDRLGAEASRSAIALATVESSWKPSDQASELSPAEG
jgi:hypothetical protein